VAKVSLLTVGQQAIMDAYLCLLHLTTGAAAVPYALTLPLTRADPVGRGRGSAARPGPACAGVAKAPCGQRVCLPPLLARRGSNGAPPSVPLRGRSGRWRRHA